MPLLMLITILVWPPPANTSVSLMPLAVSPQQQEGQPAPEEQTPQQQEGQPAPEQQTPQQQEGQPAPEEQTPQQQEGQPAPEEQTPQSVQPQQAEPKPVDPKGSEKNEAPEPEPTKQERPAPEAVPPGKPASSEDNTQPPVQTPVELLPTPLPTEGGEQVPVPSLVTPEPSATEPLPVQSDTLSNSTATQVPTPDPAQAIAGLPPIVDYQIDARLDTERHVVRATQVLRYTNHSPDIIPDLYFHLYQNAFLNNQSTYYAPPRANTYEGYWGYLHIGSLRVNGTDRTSAMSYPGTAEDGSGDRTVMRLELERPLFPGETVTVEFQFETRLTELFDRAGYHQNFYFVAQWFPKIAVWESVGQRGAVEPGWNCHPFYYSTEFYADFGRYRVDLDVPEGFIVGATGLQSHFESRDGRDHYRFEQEQVHDFAFTASPRFVRFSRVFDPVSQVSEAALAEVMQLHGVDRERAELRPVEMILLLQPEHAGQAERHFAALAGALEYCGLALGPYPYPTITLVDPSYGGRSAGGMEYPTLITTGSRIANPKGFFALEEVIIHEFVHQYFYGMVATNEFEEAWMDEGMTSYYDDLITEQLYGPKAIYQRHFRVPIAVSDLLGMPREPAYLFTRNIAIQEGGRDAVAQFGWTYYARGGYAYNAYTKPATLLHQLERELGSDVMARVMRTYAMDWRYRHPSVRDFIDVVNQVAGRNMDWFFESLFFEPGWLDYDVVSVTRHRVNRGAGYRVGSEGPVLAEFEPERVDSIQRVTIRNRGTIRYPVTVSVTFDDGSETRREWHGKHTWSRFDFVNKPPIRLVSLDPEGKLLIDTNLANNSYLVKPDPGSARRVSGRILVRFQQLLQFLGGL